MNPCFDFEHEFLKVMKIGNAEMRMAETREVARRIVKEGVQLHVNMDHAAIFADPPRQVSGPLREIGYEPVWDSRCYLSPVDGHELALYVSRLPPRSSMREQGWFENIAAVFAIDERSYNHVISQQQGNPFIHHVTMGIVAPQRRGGETELAYAYRLIPHIIDVRARIQQALGAEPGNLIISLPEDVFESRELRGRLPELTAGLHGKGCQVECMQGGGFLLQFFVLAGGRVEVAMRHGTTQAFNPSSVEKISTDEISVRRELLEIPL